MGNVRRSIPKKVREAVYRKYDGHCAYCGEEITISKMRVDHFIPLYNGGEDTIDNFMPAAFGRRHRVVCLVAASATSVLPACRMCNYYKDTFTLEKFRENLELIPQRLHDQMFIFRLAEKYGTLSSERKSIKFYFETVGKEKEPWKK